LKVKNPGFTIEPHFHNNFLVYPMLGKLWTCGSSGNPVFFLVLEKLDFQLIPRPRNQSIILTISFLDIGCQKTVPHEISFPGEPNRLGHQMERYEKEQE